MARTRQRAASPAQIEPATTPPTEENLQKVNNEPLARPLQFAEEINWRPGKSITVTVLLRRLKDLSSELNTLEQGEGGHKSFKDVARDLVNSQLIGHKDAGVRAWTLSCITQVFSIAVPEAPFTADQLHDIFALFIKDVVPALADPTSPYKQQYLDALTLLVEDRSIILILDVPNSEQLLLSLFKKTFDIAAGSTEDELDSIPSNIEYKLAKLLSEIIEEAESIEPEIVEVVLAQFMHLASHGSTHEVEYSASSKLPTAYSIARSVCNNSVTRMTKYVSEYFSSVLISASELADQGPATKDLHDAKQAHLLLRELWRSCPDVVHGIIPQIETELGAENHHLRTLAVEVVGDMIAGIGAIGLLKRPPLDPATPLKTLEGSQDRDWAGVKPSSPHAFSATFPLCYQAFLDRSKDKSALVRSAWTTSTGHIFETNAGGKGLSSEEHNALARRFADMLHDQDEKVRLAAVQAIEQLDLEVMVELLRQDTGKDNSVGNIVFGRIQDPHPPVRKACIDLLGRAWGAASDLIAKGNARLDEILGSIPSQILEARFKNLPDLNELVSSALHDLLLPVFFPAQKASESKIPDSQQNQQTKQTTETIDPDAVRARRILLLVHSLTERGQTVFNLFQKMQPSLARYMTALLECCDDSGNSPESSDRFDHITDGLTKAVPDRQLAKAHLRLLRDQDKRNRHLIKFCISAESEYAKVAKAFKELRRNISRQPEDQKVIWETLEPLLKLSSMLIYNRSHVPAYTHFARTNEDGYGAAADMLIQGIASTVPEILKIHITDLCKDLQRSQPSDKNRSCTKATSSSLKACANFARRFPGDMAADRAFYSAMVAYALYGSPSAAKHAVSIITLAASNKEMLINKIVSESIKGFKYGSSHFIARLSSLAQLRLLANEETEEFADEITKIATADVLCQAPLATQDIDLDWSTSEEPGEDLTAKLLALKILVNSLRGKQTSDSTVSLSTVAKPPYQLLNGLIEGEGELTKDTPTPKHHRAHLRLAAGTLLLKLARNRAFDRFLSVADFNRLGRLCQDERPEVRQDFGKCLRKYLGSGRLPSRYMALVFLYAHEPVKEIKSAMETWIRSRVTHTAIEKQESNFETALPILISLLAHHQYFGRQADDLIADLEESAEYIIFYLKNVATSSNLSTLYAVTQRIKTVQDGIDGSKSKNLYMIADLAEAIIRAYQEEKGWSHQLSNATFRLPAGFFSPLSSDVDAQALAERRFLPEDMIDTIPDIVRAHLKAKRRKHEHAHRGTKANGSVKTKAERKRPSDANKRRSKRSATPDSDEEEDSPKRKKSRLLNTDAEATRRSSRQNTASKNYIEADSDEDDAEMEDWDTRMAGEENKENLDHDMTAASLAEDREQRGLKQLSASQKKSQKAQKFNAGTKTLQSPLNSSQVGSRSTRTSTRRSGGGIIS